jgi:hypothetical protein
MGTRKNIGIPDRVVRVVVGLLLLSVAAFGLLESKIALVYLGLVGIAPLLAGTTGHCTPYGWLGIDTCRRKNRTP